MARPRLELLARHAALLLVLNLTLSFRAKSRNLSLLVRNMSRDYNFWVYIVTNRNHSVLYIGATNDLARRSWEHREETGTSFPANYRFNKRIYWEHYSYIRDAIDRLNPSWLDLSIEVLQDR